MLLFMPFKLAFPHKNLICILFKLLKYFAFYFTTVMFDNLHSTKLSFTVIVSFTVSLLICSVLGMLNFSQISLCGVIAL